MLRLFHNRLHVLYCILVEFIQFFHEFSKQFLLTLDALGAIGVMHAECHDLRVVVDLVV